MISKRDREIAKFEPYYKRDCLEFWLDAEGEWGHDEFTGNDEYANGCAGPAEGNCPICDP